MVYIGLGLAVFKLTQLVRYWVEVPSWAVWVATVVLAALGLWIVGQNPAWCLAVAALAGLFHRVENLLLGGSDACRVFVLRSTRRR